MNKIREHINSSNHKIYSHDQVGEMILNLGNNKYENKKNSKIHINHIQKLLLMIIVETVTPLL